MNIRAFPNGESYSYKPGQPPAAQDWNANSMYQRSEEMSQKATGASDFFKQADNGPSDLDGRAGYVRLSNVAAPALLEAETTTVTGYRTPDGDLQVTGENGEWRASSMLSVSNGGKEVFMDRPAYVNDRYMATVESLSRNDDGSNSYSTAYYQQEFNIKE